MSLIHMNRLSRTVCKQPLLSEFPSNAILLVARKISSWVRFAKAIEPDCPNLELMTNFLRMGDVSGEHACSQASDCIIHSANKFGFDIP